MSCPPPDQNPTDGNTPAGSGRASPGKLLVIDDDIGVREALCDVLMDDGYVVTAALNGADALTQLNGGDMPDVILLDLAMPVLDGYGFLRARAADQQLAQIPVIVVSATVDERVLSYDVAVAHKPIDLDNLLRQIRQIVGRPRAAGEGSTAQ